MFHTNSSIYVWMGKYSRVRSVMHSEPLVLATARAVMWGTLRLCGQIPLAKATLDPTQLRTTNEENGDKGYSEVRI